MADMDKERIMLGMTEAVDEYVASTEAWDEARLCIDTVAGTVELMEDEDAESLPDTVDVYDVMDFVEMTPDGSWVPDKETIEATATEISE